MKKIGPALFLIVAAMPLAAAAQDPSWDDAVRAVRMPFEVGADGTVSGPGGARLLAELGAADVVMFGENHGAVEIARLAQILYRETTADGFRTLVTEIGPESAAVVERLVRAGELEDFLGRRLNLMALPFFNMTAEVPLLYQVAEAGKDSVGPVLWGLDQEFMAAAPIALERLDELAANDAVRSAAGAFSRARWLNPFLIGMGSGAPLRVLDEALSTSGSTEVRGVAEQLLLSHAIYKAHGAGDYAWANERRETLMEENFKRYAESSPHARRLFLKFGGFHLHRGPSPTVDEALGVRISRWAESVGLGHANVMVDCVNGEILSPLFGGSAPCQRSDVFAQQASDAPYTLFDLRPLRAQAALAEPSRRVRYLVNGYDFLMLIRDVTPSSYLPGRLVTVWYLGAAAVLAVGVLVLMGVGVRRLWRLWRRRRQEAAA